MWCCVKFPGLSAAGGGVPQPALIPFATPATTPPSMLGMEPPSEDGTVLPTAPLSPPVATGLASDPWPPATPDPSAPAASDSTAPEGDIPELAPAPIGVDPELAGAD